MQRQPALTFFWFRMAPGGTLKSWIFGLFANVGSKDREFNGSPP
jgi:hypothetical protein